MYTRHCIILDRTVLDIESTLTLVAKGIIGSVDKFAMNNGMVIRVLIVGNAVDLICPVSVKVNAGIGPLQGLVSHTIVARSVGLAVTIQTDVMDIDIDALILETPGTQDGERCG